ncbi:hypothetical protein D3C81_1835840 [compost metagenome]
MYQIKDLTTGKTRAFRISRQSARTEHRIASVTRLGFTLQAAHMGDPDFADHCQAFRTQDLVEEVHEGALQLANFLALIAMDGATRNGCRIAPKDREVGEAGERPAKLRQATHAAV